MRLLLFISLLLAAIPALSQNGCFRAIQDGHEVTVICTGTPVFFEDCTPDPDPNAVIFYDPGPAAFNPTNFDESKLIRRGNDNRYQYTYTQPGTYRITQIINREGGGGTTTFERTFEVKAAPVPAFSVTACAGRSVRVNITDPDYDLFEIAYGDGTVRQNVSSGLQPAYTYAGSSAAYTLTVTGRYSGGACENTATQAVELLPAPTAPVIARLEVTREETSGEISLNLQSLQPGYRYVVERFSPATSRYEAVDTTQQVSQSILQGHRVTGVNTAEATSYRVRPVDRCGSSLATSSTAVSSIALGVQPGEEQAMLNWSGNNSNVGRYEVYRNGTLLQTVARSVYTYTDQGLSCGQNYCYQVASTGSNGLGTSVSAQRCVRITSSAIPPAAYLYTSYDENNQVRLLLSIPAGQEASQVRYQRSIDGAPYVTITATQQNSLTDELPSPTGVCYRATYTNPCGRESGQSNTSCPVYLIALPQEGAPAVTLGWTGYVGFPDGIGSYTVEVLDPANRVIASYPAPGNTYTDRNLREDVQELRYRIKVSSGNGSAVSYSNTVVVKQPLQVHVPTAFTPNGDGLNDVLEVKGRFIRDFRMTIYNSMGHVVFSTGDRNNGWDGTYQGKAQPAGAYAYELNIVTTSGDEVRRTGTVTLLR